MGLFDMFNYEKKLRVINEQHFKRVNDLQEANNAGKNEAMLMQSAYKQDLLNKEHEIKLKIQEIASSHEKEIAVMKNEIELERKRFSVEKEEMMLKFKQNLSDQRQAFEMDINEKLKKLIEREGVANDKTVGQHLELLKVMRDSIPNTSVAFNKQEGSPVISIENKTVGKSRKK